MSYRIYYGKKKKYPPVRKRNKNMIRIVVAIVCITGALILWRNELTSILIPGDDTVTKVAYANFKSELEAGEPFGSAFEAFCRGIIYGDTGT